MQGSVECRRRIRRAFHKRTNPTVRVTGLERTRRGRGGWTDLCRSSRAGMYQEQCQAPATMSSIKPENILFEKSRYLCSSDGCRHSLGGEGERPQGIALVPNERGQQRALAGSGSTANPVDRTDEPPKSSS